MAQRTDPGAQNRRQPAGAEPATRSPGRPRRDIDIAAVANAATQLFASGGYEAVSIQAIAEKLGVSRATLYRTVPTKDHLFGILFERITHDLHESAVRLIEEAPDAESAILGLLRLQIQAAIDTRRYLAVFFGGSGLPHDVVKRWSKWAREYEDLWVKAATRAMDAHVLQAADPVLTTRLLLGMSIWVSRWYRPSENYTGDDIADAAVQLIRGYAPRR